MNKRRILSLCLLIFFTVSCRRMVIHVEEGGERHVVPVPFLVLKQAIRLSDADTLEIEDLGGIDQSIDLRAIAKAIESGGERTKIQVRQGETTMFGRVDGSLFRIHIDSPEEHTKVDINLPLEIFEIVAEQKGETLQTEKLLRCFKGYRGTLIEVKEPDTNVKIVLK